ncbi:MAG: ImmA/IrrE family metallo-endopeptidase [Candidatus Peregrinibacteria bacterium]|nr:ImmA/IrrE family metallo-endopeptidase [Candidatus Peregrinibacteria bacterium]
MSSSRAKIVMNDDVISTLAEPRIALARGKAKEIWETLGESKIPVRLQPIITALGIPTRADHLEIDGVCQTDQRGQFLIMYQEDAPVVRQRFTVAHELAHIALEHVSLDGSASSHWSHKAQEAEANAFANELLMPTMDLKTFLKKKDDKRLIEVARRYWVSTAAASVAILHNKLLNKIKIAV